MLMKKVLILSSTPRKGGNSEILCEQFRKGAESKGNSVEMLSLRDFRIGFCTGCGACQKTGACVIADDVPAISEKMRAADVIVLSTPVYFYTLSAQMKVLIDRMCPDYTKLRNKDFYFIATAADGEPACVERTFEAFRGFLDCLEDCRECGAVRGTGAWERGEIRTSPAMRTAFELGASV